MPAAARESHHAVRTFSAHRMAKQTCTHPQSASFDKHTVYQFSLAFQCLVNISVRGSEPIRSCVVQSGTLDVVGCILEAWLANKGFTVGPSKSATGMPRETREQHQARMDILRDQAQDATLRVDSTTPSHQSCPLCLCSSQHCTCDGHTIEISERASPDQPVQPFTWWCEESLDQQVHVSLVHSTVCLPSL